MRDMIILSTLNARYSHASLGLRYLMANLGEFEPHTQLIEYTIKSEQPPCPANRARAARDWLWRVYLERQRNSRADAGHPRRRTRCGAHRRRP